jgi:hypothetical protein
MCTEARLHLRVVSTGPQISNRSNGDSSASKKGVIEEASKKKLCRVDCIHDELMEWGHTEIASTRAYQAPVCKAHNIRDSTTAGEEEEKALAGSTFEASRFQSFSTHGFRPVGICFSSRQAT